MIDLNDTSAGQVVKDRSKMKEAVKTQDRIREKLAIGTEKKRLENGGRRDSTTRFRTAEEIYLIDTNILCF